MTKIIFRRCDGGRKGESCKRLIEKACESFFGCGVKKVENLCNDRRERLMREWRSKNLNDPMQEYKLPISFGQGIEEITPPFELSEPETIEIYILEGEKSQVSERAAMDIRQVNDKLTGWELHAYLDVMDYSDNNLRWTGFGESIEEVTYHELLHACGDIKHDGILRHNEIGVKCVKKCLGENLGNPKRY